MSFCIAVGKEWLRASDLNWETGDIDWKILKTLQKRFEHVKDVTGEARVFG